MGWDFFSCLLTAGLCPDVRVSRLCLLLFLIRLANKEEEDNNHLKQVLHRHEPTGCFWRTAKEVSDVYSMYLSLCLMTSFTFIKIYFWNNSRRSCTIQQWKLNSLAPNTVSIWPFGIFTLLGIFFLVWMLHIFIATTQLQRSVWWFLYLFICFFLF